MLKRLQEELFKILLDIDYVCKKHDIKYMLCGGTLIGAIRHKGFIPWDDDIDIVMPRKEYDRFIELWQKNAPEGYILQNYNTDTDFTNNFTKIRKEKTLFYEYENEKIKKYHKGIFIDIFPAEKVAPKKIGRIMQYIACAVNLLFSKGHSSGSGGIVGIVEKILLKVKTKHHVKIRLRAEKFYKKWNKNKQLMYFLPDTIGDCKVYFPPDLFDNFTKIEFNKKEYFVVEKYIEALKIWYGDYMQLPPEEERVWKHSPIYVDFEHNFEELDVEKILSQYN